MVQVRIALASLALLVSLGCLSATGDDNVKSAKKAMIDKKEIRKADVEIERLIKQLSSTNSVERIDAIEGLANKGEDADDAFRPLCELIVMEKISKVRRTAIDSLEKLNPILAPLVVTTIIDADLQKRQEAIEKIADMGEQGRPAYPVILREYKRYLITNTYDWSYVRTRNQRMAPQLRTQPQPQQQYNLAASAFFALVKIDPECPDTVKMVTGIIRQCPHPAIIKVSGEMGKDHESIRKPIVTTLLSVLRSTAPSPDGVHQSHKLAAINALAGFGTDAKSTIPDLKRLRTDSSEEVRNAAKAALDEIDQ